MAFRKFSARELFEKATDVLAQIPGKSELKKGGGFLTIMDPRGNVVSFPVGKIDIHKSLYLMDVSIDQASRLHRGLITLRRGALRIKEYTFSLAAFPDEDDDQAILLLLLLRLQLISYHQVRRIAEASQNRTLRHFHYYYNLFQTV